MNRLPCSFLAFFAAATVAACAHSKAPSPVQDREIYSAQILKIGLVDFGTGFDRSGLERCKEEFPAVDILEEAALVAGWRKAGLVPEQLLKWGEDFTRFKAVRGLHVLFLVFEEGAKRYLRSVNYLSRTVTTVILDVRSPRCDELLRKERVAIVDSYPPLADVSVDGRGIGEAPVWVSLPKGTYEVRCVLPGQIFKPMSLVIPGGVRVLCQRENTSSPSAGAGEADETTAEEKAGSVLVYLVGAAASLAAVIIPLLFLF